MAQDFEKPVFYVFGPFELDPVRRTLTRNGVEVSVPPRSFDVLRCLLEHGGRTVDRKALVCAGWGGRLVEDGTIRQTIYQLRKVLEPGGDGPLVTTVPQKGYCLSVPVRRVPAPAPAAAGRARVRARWFVPFAAGAAAVIALAVGLAARHDPEARTAPNSVAVLPFTIAGHDTGQDDFADGVSAELIDALSRLGGLHVSARSSSFLFRGRPIAATEVARRLHVGAILEGSIVREGTRLRMLAGLVDARTGFTLWSHSYDIDRRNLLDAQADMAESVAAALKGVLGPKGGAALSLGGTHNPAAYDAYLRGLKLAREADAPESRQGARAAFEAAIALDPGFALARAWRARELTEIYDNTGDASLLHEADAEAGRSLAIAPELGIAHLARADIARAVQNFLEAEREIRTALQYAPNDIQVLVDDAYLEAEFRHPAAALKAAQLGVSLDPLSASAYAALAYAQLAAHDNEGAQASLGHARLMGGNAPGISLIEAMIAFQRGDNAAAAAACVGGARGWMSELCLAVAEHRLGDADGAAAHLAALRRALGKNGAFQYAEVYAQWSQSEEALKWLDVAFRTHDAGLAMMKADMFLEPIRALPQFAAIETGLRFPP